MDDPPAPPGPGLPAAVGWVLALLAFQFAGGLVVAYYLAVVAVADRRDPAHVLDAPTLFTIAAGTTLVFAVLVALHQFGPAAGRALAARAPAGRHVGLALLLLLPLLTVASALTVALTAAADAAGLPAGFADPTPGLVEALRRYPGWRAAVVVVGFVGLAAGLGEEVFFRGVLGRGLVARWGWGGVGLTAVLFGAVHLHPVQAVVAAVLGVVFHAAYLWTRSLAVPVLLHAGFNGLALLAGVVADDGEANLPPAVAAAALGAAVAAMWLLYRTRARWVLPDGSEWSPGFPTAEAPPPDAAARLEPGCAGFGPAVVVAASYLAYLTAVVRA